MISEEMEIGINAQIHAELESAYLYMAMAAYFDGEGLPGMRHWMKVQSREEHEHAMKLFDYLSARGGRTRFMTLDAPPPEWASPVAAFEAALEHERKITAGISALWEMAADKTHEYTATPLLSWFLAEQVEEEAKAARVVSQLRLVGDDALGLREIDRELGKRKDNPCPPPNDNT